MPSADWYSKNSTTKAVAARVRCPIGTPRARPNRHGDSSVRASAAAAAFGTFAAAALAVGAALGGAGCGLAAALAGGAGARGAAAGVGVGFVVHDGFLWVRCAIGRWRGGNFPLGPRAGLERKG